LLLWVWWDLSLWDGLSYYFAAVAAGYVVQTWVWIEDMRNAGQYLPAIMTQPLGYDAASKSGTNSFKTSSRRPTTGLVRFAWIRTSRRTGRYGDRANQEIKARAFTQSTRP
jgi:hypothetical protein